MQDSKSADADILLVKTLQLQIKKNLSRKFGMLIFSRLWIWDEWKLAFLFTGNWKPANADILISKNVQAAICKQLTRFENFCNNYRERIKHKICNWEKFREIHIIHDFGADKQVVTENYKNN